MDPYAPAGYAPHLTHGFSLLSPPVFLIVGGIAAGYVAGTALKGKRRKSDLPRALAGVGGLVGMVVAIGRSWPLA